MDGPLPTRRLTLKSMIALSICLAGIQFAWTVELAYGTPYLLSLGLAPYQTAFVWLAGPLSGLFVQPIVGAYADKCTLRLGRRRPFMLVGSFFVVASILCITYAKEIAAVIVHVVPVHDSGDQSDTDKRIASISIAAAIVGFYVLDFAINAVQSSSRALIVDVTPHIQQNDANIWAGRMLAVGNVVGYFVGQLDLAAIAPVLGETQFRCLCVIACWFYVVTVGITVLAVEEVPVNPLHCVNGARNEWWRPIQNAFLAMFKLPQSVQSVCNVQLFAWIGWFPFLFFSTAWVGSKVQDSKADDGTRAGSYALLFFAINSALTGFILPYYVSRTNGRQPPDGASPSTWQAVQGYFTLPRIWSLSLWGFAGLMVSTYWVSNDVVGATVIVGLTGVCFGIIQWVPFTLLSECISYYDMNASHQTSQYQQLTTQDDTMDISMVFDSEHTISESDSLVSVPPRTQEQRLEAGVILGIHNIYIVLPQFLSTVLCSVLFVVTDYLQRVQPVDDKHDPFGWAMRIGAVACVWAGMLALKVSEIEPDKAA